MPEPSKSPKTAREIASGIKSGLHLDFGLGGGGYIAGYLDFDGTGEEKVEWLRYGIIERQWGINPEWATQDILDIYSQAGFNTVRFPVAFGPYMKNDTHMMDPAILDALEECVCMILDSGMYAIFCPSEYFGVAFDGEGLNDDWMRDEYSPYIDARYAALWRQVAERFKGYGDRLAFEANNEPHFNFDLYWEGEGFGGLDSIAATLAKRINEMNHIFVDAVRSTGGNNETRLLLLNITPWVLDAMVLPEDGYIGIAPHYYECAFWGHWDRNDERARNEVDALIDEWAGFIEEYGVPFVITEGAIMEGMPYRDRLDLAGYSIDRFMEIGIPWVWFGESCDAWDDPQEHRAALYDWRGGRWVWPELRDILLKPNRSPISKKVLRR